MFVWKMLLISFCSCVARSIRLSKSTFPTQRLRLASTSLALSNEKTEITSNGDELITGLNGNQDITVKVVSCREVVQEAILKNDLSPQAAKALGEVITCGLMMGSSLKGDETLQINLVGNGGIRNVMAITDGELKIRGMVGNPQFRSGTTQDSVGCGTLLGEGQVQVVRNHPTYKAPMNGIVLLRDTTIALNLALYMAESEQRSAVMITDIAIDGNLCRRALGVLVERLPGASDENIETSIKNLESVERAGLASYLVRTDEERSQDEGMFRDFSMPLNKILDDCLANMGEDIRWSKSPRYRCGCGIDKVWRALRAMPEADVRGIVETEESVEVKCEFCGQSYRLEKAEIEKELLSS